MDVYQLLGSHTPLLRACEDVESAPFHNSGSIWLFLWPSLAPSLALSLALSLWLSLAILGSL